jgi:hypothetical protein
VDSETIYVWHSRDFEKSRDQSKYVCITLRSIVESGRVDQNNTTAVEIRDLRYLYGVRAGLQCFSNVEIRSTGEVDELYKSWRRMMSLFENPGGTKGGTNAR